MPGIGQITIDIYITEATMLLYALERTLRSGDHESRRQAKSLYEKIRNAMNQYTRELEDERRRR